MDVQLHRPYTLLLTSITANAATELAVISSK